eukprot:6907035-Pyramimonas_sp.AAC.1
MEVNGEDEEVDFSPDSPDTPPLAQEPIVPDSSQQGDLPAQDAPPAAQQEPPPAPAQAASAASSDGRAR